MQKRLARCLAGFLLSIVAVGCGPRHASFVSVDNVALGRVVIYRNGVAFYERRALVQGGILTVRVPRDRVDDFLKSLTVVDARSRQPLPVSIPRDQIEDGANLVMHLRVPSRETADVVLTYVTESPAWKPSYRVVVGEHHDVMLEGVAIVDNTSGEDWKDVIVGVGSSSALSFRYDLWSVRQVQRETLASEARFAIAPPTGGSPYAGANGQLADGSSAKREEVISELGDDEIRRVARAAPAITRSEEIVATSAVESNDDEVEAPSGSLARRGARSVRADPAPRKVAEPTGGLADANIARGDLKVRQLAERLARTSDAITIESYATGADSTSTARASERANVVRNQLIDRGVAPGRIQIVPKVDPTGNERVRLLAGGAPVPTTPAPAQPRDLGTAPVGESHFASAQPMTIERGASAMVSIVRNPTEGEVVYLYDAESERGNAQFAFRAVRFKNPTDSTLETGPVTVYGKERFIGEGLTEAIPPRSSAVVPFALDRQIVVERTDSQSDRLARLVTLQRGVLTAEVQRVKKQQLTLTNRMNQPAKVFVRHTVGKGWTLGEAPPAFERIGDAHLFAIELRPNEVKSIAITEATPLERTLDLNATDALDMVQVWIEAPEGTPALKDQLRKLLAQHKALVDLAQAQVSTRRRLEDYRGRMDELHGQLVTLQAVKTGGDLMSHLKAKMRDISDRVQKTTIEIVDQEEKILLARVRFQDLLAELSLPDAASVTREASNRAPHP